MVWSQSSNMWVLLLLQSSSIIITKAGCPTCDCFDVDIIGLKLDVLTSEPLYIQAVSNGTNMTDIDSGCYNFTKICTPKTALLQTTLIYKNGTILKQAFLISGSGPFYAIGAVSTKEFAIGEPCENVYVVYQCFQVEACVTDRSLAAVAITSTLKRASSDCIEKGMKMAHKYFPSMNFTRLPRTIANPCRPCSSQQCAN